MSDELMRLTLALLGWELDVTVGPVVTDDGYVDAGTTTSTPQPIGFTPWEDAGPVHQFEPEDRR